MKQATFLLKKYKSGSRVGAFWRTACKRPARRKPSSREKIVIVPRDDEAVFSTGNQPSADV